MLGQQSQPSQRPLDERERAEVDRVPAGLQRTYPNFITQEGVLGAEWSKMDRRVTPRHNVTLPYTRMLVGPMDYTPGGFRNETPSTFEVRAEMPMVQNTRGQTLAMYAPRRGARPRIMRPTESSITPTAAINVPTGTGRSCAAAGLT